MKVDTRVDGPWDDKQNGNDDIEVVMTRQLAEFHKYELYPYHAHARAPTTSAAAKAHM